MSNTIDSSLFLSSYKAEQSKSSGSQLGKDDFLKLLIAQLQNQDPSNPMEDREFIAQMAQFSTLEQMMNMNKTIQGFIDVERQNTMIGFNQFIGKEVSWHKIVQSKDRELAVEEGKGKVISVEFKENNVYLMLEDGTKLEPGNISRIEEISSSSDNSLIQGSMLIGRTVTYVDKDGEEKTSKIHSVSLKNGKVLFYVDEGAKSIVSSQMIKIAA